MEINLIIAVEPDAVVTEARANPVSSTLAEMIRSYHVPGKAKDQWQDADVQGLIAIGAIDELLADGRVDRGRPVELARGDPARLVRGRRP